MINRHNFKDTWQKLNKENTTQDGYVKLQYPSENINISLAVESVTMKPAILVRVSHENIPAGLSYPESKKFEVFPNYDSKEKTVTLCLRLNDKEYYDIFSILAEDIVHRIAQEKNEKKCVEVFIHELLRWQEFLKQYTGNALSEEAQRGLYGELYFLKEILLNHFELSQAIGFWQGADRAIHDFQVASQAVEIKTYAGASQPKIMVSNMRQLDSKGLKKLYVGVFLLDVRQSRNNTLNQMVEAIEDAFSSDPSALKVFEEKLIKYGYIKEHTEQYSSIGYTVLDSLYYHVNAAFPKITHTNVPEGIGDLKYSVMLSACTNSKVSQELLRTSLQDSVNE